MAFFFFSGILCTHVNDLFLCGINEFFIYSAIEPLKSIFTIWSELSTAFKYLSLNITQSDEEIILGQTD